MSLFFSSSSSGRSLATTMPSSWSSRPAGVMQKLSSATRVHTWGASGSTREAVPYPGFREPLGLRKENKPLQRIERGRDT